MEHKFYWLTDMLKRLHGIIRPTPSEFILKMLPLYLEETERPLKQQILLTGCPSAVIGLGDKHLITAVKARAITAGCIRSAHHTANYLVSPEIKIPKLSEEDYAKFYHTVTRIVVGSIDVVKNGKISKDTSRYTKIVEEAMHSALLISERNIWSKWDNIDSVNWKAEISGLYYHALRESGRGEHDPEVKLLEEQKLMTVSFAQHIGESHWDMHKFLMKEFIDLFAAKRRYL